MTPPAKLRPEHTYVALVHHPVLDRNGRVVSTALTNLDLHDIARSSRTYGLGGFFIVHPVEAQRELAERIADHWRKDGAELNDFRRDALSRVVVVDTLESAEGEIARREGVGPALVATSARSDPRAVGYRALRRSLAGPALLVLGTGWGLTDDVVARCAHRLRPVDREGGGDYNHLSVRSACAIILDRLYGDRED